MLPELKNVIVPDTAKVELKPTVQVKLALGDGGPKLLILPVPVVVTVLLPVAIITAVVVTLPLPKILRSVIVIKLLLSLSLPLLP